MFGKNILFPKIESSKTCQRFRTRNFNVRFWRYYYFKKLSFLYHLTKINFWRLNFLKYNLQKSVSSMTMYQYGIA